MISKKIVFQLLQKTVINIIVKRQQKHFSFIITQNMQISKNDQTII